MTPQRPPQPDGLGPPRIALVVSRYNASVTDALEAGARAEFAGRVGPEGRCEVVPAPGAFELVALAFAAAQTGRFDGVCALGCVIRGETSHDRYINGAVAHGLAELYPRTGVPGAFGLLTVDTVEQARERAGGAKGNKGAEAMGALLETIEAIRRLQGPGGEVDGGLDGGTKRPDKAAGGRG